MPEKFSPKTIIITGASDGIGAEAARQLTALGHKVVIVGRSKEKTTAIASELQVPFFVADFADLQQVRKLASNVIKDYPHIDVLVNNAGGIMGKRQLTVDGHEKTFQVNHLAPFLLTNLLLPVLISSRTSILNTSSVANKLFGHINIEDLEAVNNYSPNKAYGDSKLANILFTKELHRRYQKVGISAVAFHPGNVATNFSADSTSALRFLYRTPLRRLFLISPKQGADNLVWLATSNQWQSGAYYDKRQVTEPNEQANDQVLARQLWERSAVMTGLKK